MSLLEAEHGGLNETTRKGISVSRTRFRKTSAVREITHKSESIQRGDEQFSSVVFWARALNQRRTNFFNG